MSGLETTGKVLWSLSVVIAALEHYEKGIHTCTTKHFRRHKSELRSLRLQLGTERDIFINMLEQLLEGLVEIEHMTKFLSDSEGEAWQNAKLDMKLRARLGDEYEVYLGNVDGMKRSLEMIREKLALDPDGKTQFSDPKLFKQEYKRLKFSLSKSVYSELLSALTGHNQSLTGLIKQPVDFEPFRNRTKTRACPNFSALQNYAHSLYDILRSSMRCTCKGHAVKLRLENRSKRSETDDNSLDQTPFRVIFTYESALVATPQDWKEANIRRILDAPQRDPVASCTPQAGTETKVTRRVRFVSQEVEMSSNSTLETATVQPRNSYTEKKLQQILNLCPAITKFQQSKSVCAGYLLDNLKRKYGIYPLDTRACDNNEIWSAHTLRQVFTKGAGLEWRLMQHAQFKLAVDMASSVLQLYKTPWLSDDWSSDDVYFVHRPGAPLSSTYQHAFIYRRISSAVSTQESLSRPLMRTIIRNQTLFNLGVLLIELVYGKSIEDLQTDDDRDCQGALGPMWHTVERLAGSIALEAGELYSDAVQRCIRCDFVRNHSSLQDHDFQQAVFDGVVIPLQKTLQYLKGDEEEDLPYVRSLMGSVHGKTSLVNSSIDDVFVTDEKKEDKSTFGISEDLCDSVETLTQEHLEEGDGSSTLPQLPERRINDTSNHHVAATASPSIDLPPRHLSTGPMSAVLTLTHLTIAIIIGICCALYCILNFYWKVVLISGMVMAMQCWFTYVYYRRVFTTYLALSFCMKTTLVFVTLILVIWCATLSPLHIWFSPLELWTKYIDHPPVQPVVIHHPRGPISVDVFAIHGLGSDPLSAWTYRANDTRWLKDILPFQKGCEQIRVTMINHQTRWDSHVPDMDLSEHAEMILSDIQYYNQGLRPIIFIAHSFGGILLKKALILATTRSGRDQRIAERTKGILFLGVPHFGTPSSFLASLMACTSYWRGSSTALLETLSESNPALKELDTKFREIYIDGRHRPSLKIESPYICNFLEMQPERFGRLSLAATVDTKSGWLDYVNDNPKLDTDHRGLNKFQSPHDGNFKKFFRFFERAMLEATGGN